MSRLQRKLKTTLGERSYVGSLPASNGSPTRYWYASRLLEVETRFRTRPGWLLGWTAFFVLAFGIAYLSLASPAAATPPDRFTIVRPDEGTDPAGTTCAFPVHFSQVETLDWHVFFDGDGNVVKQIVHIDYDATIDANGKTIVERDTYTRTFYADDTARDTGPDGPYPTSRRDRHA